MSEQGKARSRVKTVPVMLAVALLAVVRKDPFLSCWFKCGLHERGGRRRVSSDVFRDAPVQRWKMLAQQAGDAHLISAPTELTSHSEERSSQPFKVGARQVFFFLVFLFLSPIGPFFFFF